MSELFAFIQLGFKHITDLGAMDHILFLLALAAIYRPRDWRKALWVITAFTVGHSITLGLAVTGAITLPMALIEFLIPVTIVATCTENILVADRERAPWHGRYRPVFAGVFAVRACHSRNAPAPTPPTSIPSWAPVSAPRSRSFSSR